MDMNMYVNLIQKTLKCDESVAKQVYENMGEYHLSNMSDAQLKRAIKDTFQAIQFTNKVANTNWTLMVMKVLRIPQVQKLNPYVEVSVKQMDALESVFKYTLANGGKITMELILNTLHENKGE